MTFFIGEAVSFKNGGLFGTVHAIDGERVNVFVPSMPNPMNIPGLQYVWANASDLIPALEAL